MNVLSLSLPLRRSESRDGTDDLVFARFDTGEASRDEVFRMVVNLAFLLADTLARHRLSVYDNRAS